MAASMVFFLVFWFSGEERTFILSIVEVYVSTILVSVPPATCTYRVGMVWLFLGLYVVHSSYVS